MITVQIEWIGPLIISMWVLVLDFFWRYPVIRKRWEPMDPSAVLIDEIVVLNVLAIRGHMGPKLTLSPVAAAFIRTRYHQSYRSFFLFRGSFRQLNLLAWAEKRYSMFGGILGSRESILHLFKEIRVKLHQV